MMGVAVYGLPGCVQCKATERQLKKRGIEYEYIDLSQNAAEMEFVRAKGVTVAPYVVIEQDGKPVDHWTGFQPERINAIG